MSLDVWQAQTTAKDTSAFFRIFHTNRCGKVAKGFSHARQHDKCTVCQQSFRHPLQSCSFPSNLVSPGKGTAGAQSMMRTKVAALHCRQILSLLTEMK